MNSSYICSRNSSDLVIIRKKTEYKLIYIVHVHYHVEILTWVINEIINKEFDVQKITWRKYIIKYNRFFHNHKDFGKKNGRKATDYNCARFFF